MVAWTGSRGGKKVNPETFRKKISQDLSAEYGEIKGDASVSGLGYWWDGGIIRWVGVHLGDRCGFEIMSSVLELLNFETSKWRSGAIRYLSGDKDLRIVSSPKSSSIFLFKKLISLVRCPKMATCSAGCCWMLLRGHYFIKTLRPHIPITMMVAIRNTKGVWGKRKTNFGRVEHRRLYEYHVFELSLKGWSELCRVQSSPAGGLVMSRENWWELRAV